MEKKLSELKPGDTGKILKIFGEGNLRKKFLDMGVMKGVEVEVVKVAPLGDPVDTKVKGYHLSLRKEEASQISLEVEET